MHKRPNVNHNERTTSIAPLNNATLQLIYNLKKYAEYATLQFVPYRSCTARSTDRYNTCTCIGVMYMQGYYRPKRRKDMERKLNSSS